MKVLLAGYNVDSEIIDELKERSGYEKDNLTPETLSAAYARISRDPRDIDQLREEARSEVEKSRKSNSTIIFGLGHASVAEHAYLNFDVIGLSRYAVEEVQKFRLASFTEKSQRYITLEDDYYIPVTLTGDLRDRYIETIKIQNSSYHKLYEGLKEYLFNKHSEMVKKKRGRTTVDGWAKEDARYVVSLATLSQFGMSVNGRTLEHMLRRFSASNLAEIRELGRDIYEKVNGFAPSIIKYTEETDYDRARVDKLRSLVGELSSNRVDTNPKEVNLISASDNIDDRVLAAILFEYGFGSYEDSLTYVGGLSDKKKSEIVALSQESRMSYDSVCRGYEFGDFTFEVTLTATNYAQFKRHRLSSQLMGDYQLEYGVKMPHTIEEAGLTDIFNEAVEATNNCYLSLKRDALGVADYILTNAHRRKVLVKMNLRELYHFVGLRSDQHAQWDIREISEQLREVVKEKAPITAQLLMGKDSYNGMREK